MKKEAFHSKQVAGAVLPAHPPNPVLFTKARMAILYNILITKNLQTMVSPKSKVHKRQDIRSRLRENLIIIIVMLLICLWVIFLA
jgi:hypothetical protein